MCKFHMSRKKTVSKEESRNKILKRIARIEGQLNGIKRMVVDERECIDIIQQITAIRQATAMLGIELLKDEFICKREDQEEIDEKYLKTLFKVS